MKMMKDTMVMDVSQDRATTCDVQQRFMHHAVPPADGIRVGFSRVRSTESRLPPKMPRTGSYRTQTLACLRNRLENFCCRVKFIPIDCMAHPGISLEADNPTHIGERGCGLLDSLPRNVRVGIARAEKTRRAVQKAGVAELCAFRPDQPSGERDQSTITLRVPRHIFGCQACALGESQDGHPRSRNLCTLQTRKDGVDQFESRSKPRLVAFDRSQERIGIPGVAGGLRRQVGEFG